MKIILINISQEKTEEKNMIENSNKIENKINEENNIII